MKVLVLVALAACGTDAITVGVVVPGDAYYFKARIGDAGWQTPSGTFDGITTTYELAIDGDFELVRVCEHRDGVFIANELFGTIDDAAVTIGSWELPTCVENDAKTIVVTGTLDRAGTIAIGDVTATVAANQRFTLDVAPGVHDITTISSGFEAVIRHDMSISAPIDLGTVAMHGSPMVSDDYGALLVTGEAAVAYTQVVTRNGTSSIVHYDPKSAVFITADQMVYGDVQSFHFVATSPSTLRTAVAGRFSTTPPPFDLLGLLQPFEWNPEGRTVTWTPLGEFYTTASVQFADSNGSQTATASKRWLEHHAATSIMFDETEPPGYRWRTIAPVATLGAQLWSPDLVLQSSTSHVD